MSSVSTSFFLLMSASAKNTSGAKKLTIFLLFANVQVKWQGCPGREKGNKLV